jgi:glycosyltransferase involved in cell wall biosynthesis
MITILFIHQSAELYGSDKTLLFLLKHLDKTKFLPVVVLPNDGPLKAELEKENIIVTLAPVIKLYRKMFSPKNIIRFLREINLATKTLDDLNNQYHFDLIYSNTLAVLLGLFYAKKRKIKHIWHVHEIIESPKVITKLFLKLLSQKGNSKIVYNSIATQKFWDVNTKISNKSCVIQNGLEIPSLQLSELEVLAFRAKFFKADKNEVVIALVGRISRWKGQLVLLKAFSKLAKTNQNITLVFVGSPPPNQEIFLEKLNAQIQEYQISKRVILLPFQEEISEIWQSIDIAVVPSIEPEPFGLVALEAMLAKKPVVASNHGGLTEIIVNEETGFLVTPNNEIALSQAIKKLIENPELRTAFGEKGYQRAIHQFSIEKYVNRFEDLFHKGI